MKWIYRAALIGVLSYPVAAIGIWGVFKTIPNLLQTGLAGTILFCAILLEVFRDGGPDIQKRESKTDD